MLRITRDGAKMIDKKMEFKEDLLSRRKQEKLIFKYLFRFDTLLLNFFLVFWYSVYQWVLDIIAF